MISFSRLLSPQGPRKEAFTLIEVVLVLVLLGILTGLSAPHFKGFFDEQELVQGATYLKGSLDESFAQARSEQFIGGLVFDNLNGGSVRVVRCDYVNGPSGPECGSARSETLLLWEEKPVLEALNLRLMAFGEVLFAPPHGDIIGNRSFDGDPEKLEIQLTHIKSGDQRTLQIFAESGLIHILDS